jgi:hypothetical protein
MQPVLHAYIAIVMRFHGGNGVSGPVWIVAPILILGGLFRLWQLSRRR